MRHLRQCLFIFLISLTVSAAGAAEVCEINKAADVIACAIKNHPNVVQAEAQVPIASINKELSSRWLNPELEGGAGYTREADESGLIGEIAVMQTIETLTKRNARRTQADAEYDLAFAASAEQREQAAVQTLSILNRLRQIDRERYMLDETIKIFSAVIKRYKARPALSPEDRVTADLFGFVLTNHRIEKNQLDGEEKELAGNLKTILARDIPALQKFFLYSPKVWPKIGADNVENSAVLTREQANITQARAAYLEAQSSSFSGFRIGPYIQTKPGEFGKIETGGVKFTIPIPIYSSAKPAQAWRMAVSAAESGYEAKKRELENSIDNLKSKYALGIAALGSYNVKEIEKHQARTKKLFGDGRVSGALLIESYRQMLDNVRIYHQYEMETLQALWRIYILQGKLLTNLDEVYDEKI